MKNDEREDALLARIRAQRWKDRLRCPRCGGTDCGVHARSGAGRRRKLLCNDCGRTFNDLTGTPFARSHVPLSAWFAAARLMAESNPTCVDIARAVKVKVATAWRIRRVLRRALTEPSLRRLLTEEAPPCA